MVVVAEHHVSVGAHFTAVTYHQVTPRCTEVADPIQGYCWWEHALGLGGQDCSPRPRRWPNSGGGCPVRGTRRCRSRFALRCCSTARICTYPWRGSMVSHRGNWKVECGDAAGTGQVAYGPGTTFTIRAKLTVRCSASRPSSRRGRLSGERGGAHGYRVLHRRAGERMAHPTWFQRSDVRPRPRLTTGSLVVGSWGLPGVRPLPARNPTGEDVN